MTTIKPTAPELGEWSLANTLPEAARLFRRWLASERAETRRFHVAATRDPHVDQEEESQEFSDYMGQLDRYSDALGKAVAIWNEEMDAIRDRIADRIAAEVPRAEDIGLIGAIREDDYTRMAP